MNERKALVVAYAFPPVGGIAVQRPLKFTRYLSLSGWQPTVLTTGNAYSATMDPSLLQEIPTGVHVERVPDPVASLLSRAAMTLPAGGGTTSSTTVEPSGTTSKSANVRTAKPSFKSRLKTLLKSWKDALFVPDESVLWAIRAGVAGCRVVREQGIDCVYTTSGPHSTHIAGWMIQHFTGIQWIADFRDPWTDNMHYQRSGWQRSFELWLERRVFRHADSVVTVTEGFKALFQSKYPEYKGKIEVIRNGVDPDDFPVVARAPSPEERSDKPFTFFYAGILYPKRSPAPFLQALHKVLQSGWLTENDVQADFAGVFDYPGQSENRELVDRLGLQSVVNALGYLPRERALDRMMTADGLLLIGENVPESKLYVPGKLYEYLYAQRPILAILEQGEAARLITAAQAGTVFDATDVDGMAREVVRLVQDHRSKQAFLPNLAEVTRHTRRSQTEQLAQLMERLVGNPQNHSVLTD